MRESITLWLEGLDLGQYSEAFVKNEIDLEVLPDLDEDDLKELGVSLGHRKKLLKVIAQRAKEQKDRAPAERRQLTVMFCDLVGSTALARKIDPEDMRDLMLAYQNAVSDEVSNFNGHVAKYMGDGVLAYFGWPVAHEDAGERAVRSAAAIMDAMKRLKTPDGQPIQARVGIATGVVVVGDLIGEGASREESVVGETPNLAARLQGVAEPGQVVIAETTRDLLGGAFDLVALPPQDLKGIGEAVPSFVVGEERAIGSRFEARSGQKISPLVGRDRELADMLRAWSNAKAGSGAGMLLVGEAGIGKSRLTRGLIDAVATDDHDRVSLQCSPHHSDSALWPIVQLLQSEIQFAADDSTAAKLDKIEAFVAEGHDTPSEAASLLADLLGVDDNGRFPANDLTPLAKRVRTLAVLTDWLISLTKERPVLFVLEDAHWIDATTLELIEQCFDLIDGARMMILMTSRPDDQPVLTPRPNLGKTMLGPLGRDAVESIVADLAGGRKQDLVPVDAILSRTDGVPLFVEEMTAMLLQQDDVEDAPQVRDVEDIPGTIHDLLLMRLDQLGNTKRFAQQAACFGRFFSRDQLALTSGLSTGALEPKLQRLTQSGLVDEVHGQQDQYYFKHALVQEAAYSSILRSQRVELHRTIAESLEKQERQIEPEVLAHHCSRGRMSEKAVEYWEAAGQQAMGASALVEASGHFSRALEALRETPETPERDERELMLLLSLGDPLVSTRGFAADEVSETFGRAREICQGLTNVELQFPVLWGLVSFYLVRSELGKAHELSSQFLELAQAAEMDDLILTGHYLVGASYFWRGDFERAAPVMRAFVEDSNPETDLSYQIAPAENPKIDTMSYLAWVKWLVGSPDAGASYSEDCIALGRTLTLHDLAYSLGFAAWSRQYRREYDRVAELADEMIQLSIEQEFPYWLSAGKILKGGALVRNGDFETGMEEIEGGLEIWGATGSRLFKASFLQVRAEAYLVHGDFDKAMQDVDEALEAIASTGERINEADVTRLKGEIFEKSGHSDKAAKWYRAAIKIAEGQNARAFALRSQTSLARLLRGPEELKDLQATYDTFEEGFDTPDLKDAKALISELS